VASSLSLYHSDPFSVPRYCREESGQVYAAGVPLIAAFVSAVYANPDELKALDPGICNTVNQCSIDDMPCLPKIRWTKAEKKQHYHQCSTFIDPKRVDTPTGSPRGSVPQDDGSPAEETASAKGEEEDDDNDDDNAEQDDDNNSYVVPSDSDESVGDIDELEEIEDWALEESEQTGAHDDKETSDEVVVDHDQTEIEATEEQQDNSVPDEVQGVAEVLKGKKKVSSRLLGLVPYSSVLPCRPHMP